MSIIYKSPTISPQKSMGAFSVGRVILGTFPGQADSRDEEFRDGLHGLLPEAGIPPADSILIKSRNAEPTNFRFIDY